MSDLRTRPLTVDDLLRPGNPYDRGELWDGRWVVCEPSGGPAEVVAIRIGGRLWAWVEDKGLGWVVGSNQGFVVARDPDRVLSPDAAFVSHARLPHVPSEGFIEGTPEFLVEVVSPDDREPNVVAKAALWISHGALVAWVVCPAARRVTILRRGRAAEVVTEGGSADAAPALPGFEIPLERLFHHLP